MKGNVRRLFLIIHSRTSNLSTRLRRFCLAILLFYASSHICRNAWNSTVNWDSSWNELGIKKETIVPIRQMLPKT